MDLLPGKVAVVTGAAQGIGASYAEALAAEGARVVLADIDIDSAEKTASAIRSRDLQAVAAFVDISDKASTRGLAAEVERQYGSADILVNNAAIYHRMRVDSQMDVDIEYWRKIFSVNLDGALLMTQAFAPGMIQKKWGRIINQSSTGAFLGGGGHYAVAKLALVGLTKGFARELGPYGITVNAIAPGPIFTEATASTVSADRLEFLIGQMAIPLHATPDVLLGTLLHLCGDGSEWVTGQTLLVDGGSTAKI